MFAKNLWPMTRYIKQILADTSVKKKMCCRDIRGHSHIMSATEGGGGGGGGGRRVFFFWGGGGGGVRSNRWKLESWNLLKIPVLDWKALSKKLNLLMNMYCVSDTLPVYLHVNTTVIRCCLVTLLLKLPLFFSNLKLYMITWRHVKQQRDVPLLVWCYTWNEEPKQMILICHFCEWRYLGNLLTSPSPKSKPGPIEGNKMSLFLIVKIKEHCLRTLHIIAFLHEKS